MKDVASLLRDGADGHLARLSATYLDATIKGQDSSSPSRPTTSS